jgi:L-alanine-DL-glutamate epimerase-like enolase superfamily enzyme
LNVKNGKIKVPKDPGLGITLKKEELKKHMIV